MEIAILMREKGEYVKAIRINQSLILKERLDRDLKVRVLSELGLNYRIYGDLDKSIHYFHQVLDHDSKNIRAYSELKKIYMDRRAWDDAYTAQKSLLKLKGIKEKKDLVHIRIEAGMDRASQGDTDDAVHHLKQALSLDKNCVHALISLGNIFYKQGKKKKALSFWRRVGELNHHYLPLISFKMEDIFFELNRSDELEILYKSCLEKDPENINLHLLLAHFFLRKNMIKQAKALFEKVIELNPLIPEAYASLLHLSSFDSEENLRPILKDLSETDHRYRCKECGFISDEITWRCPSCKEWDSILSSF
jgi:lipopolysaccharide biosynthesis regulator YciM